MSMDMLQDPFVPAHRAEPEADAPSPVMLSFAPNWPVRVVLFRVSGTALILSAAGLWLMPGSFDDSELLLLKLGISIFFFFCGLALLMRNHEDTQPDACFDPIRHEVRVLQKNDRGQPQTLLRRRYDSLGCVEFRNNSVELFDVDGSLLMRLVIDDPEVRQSLRAQLSGLVCITG